MARPGAEEGVDAAATRPGEQVVAAGQGQHAEGYQAAAAHQASSGRSETGAARPTYGALASSGGDESSREHARRRHRRWLQAGSAAVALSFVVLLAASVERSQPASEWWPGPTVVLQGEALAGAPATPTAAETGGTAEAVLGPQPGTLAPNSVAKEAARTQMLGETGSPAEKTYCSVFQDPTECEKQAVRGTMKYWTNMEVRGELWKTMKALAELELRESTMHKAHKAKAQEQAQLFDLFRQTMQQEVEDIHRIQDEMHEKHTAAFKQLVLQLSDMAMDLKNYTDTNIGQVSGHMDALQSDHDFNNQRILKSLADKINEVNRKIEALHAESMTAVNGTQEYAEDVESAMKAGDIRLDGMIKQIEVDFNNLDYKEQGDWVALSNALQTAEFKQEDDRKMLDTKIDTDVGQLRTESNSALTAEQAKIRQQLAEAMSIVAEGIVSLTQNTTARYDGVQSAIDQMIAEQNANNHEQEVHIGKLRSDFERDRDAAFARLEAADVRLDKAFADLAAAKGRLESEAAADREFLLSKINTDVKLRDAEAIALRGWAKVETDALHASLVVTQKKLDSERARLQAQRDGDMVAMPKKIDADINAWNASINAQMNTDNTAIHATLTARMQEAGDALTELAGQMTTKNADMRAHYEGMKELQDQNNLLQQNAIDDLQRDSLLEKVLTEARLAALDGNMTAVKERLKTVRAEISGIQDKDRADIRNKVDADFATTKTKLEGDLSTSHTTLWSKLTGGISTLNADLARLRDTVESREGKIFKFSEDISRDQRRQTTKQNLEMDAIDRTQSKDEREIDSLTDILLEKLGTVKARLATELARSKGERDRDDAEMRATIVSDNNVTETDANNKLAALHRLMDAELTSVMSGLTSTLDAQKQLEETDFQDLVGNLSAWDAAQTAENTRQRCVCARVWLCSVISLV